jgi:hypothetical protein
MTSDLILALRAYTTRGTVDDEPSQTRRRRPRRPKDQRVLVFDTECTIDAVQGLMLGSYQYYRWGRGEFRCLEEGLFYADGLPETDPEGYAVLTAYVDPERHPAMVAQAYDDKLKLYSLRQFLAKVFWPAAYQARALIVGFNLPFDLSRLALDSGEAKGFYRGGFSFQLWEYHDKVTGVSRESQHKPRLCIRHLDSKRAFIGFTRSGTEIQKDRAGSNGD